MKESLLEIKNLSKIYHNEKDETMAIKDLSFSIEPNEIVAIVGPSGCGKSTLLSILANIEKQSSGEIIFKDQKDIGYMLQSDSLFPWLSIKENCLLGLKIKKEKNLESINNVLNLLNKYGLGDFIDKYPNNLSGGMKQRCALIRTMATNPNILLLDEPYSALDYQTRLALSDDMYRIIKNEKKTAILITHDIAEAICMADRIIVLTKRPCSIKKIYQINLKNKDTPINNRKDPNFNYYYDMIWRDLDVHI